MRINYRRLHNYCVVSLCGLTLCLVWTRQWELKLIRIKLMQVNLPNVNAASPVIFCSEIKFP